MYPRVLSAEGLAAVEAAFRSVEGEGSCRLDAFCVVEFEHHLHGPSLYPTLYPVNAARNAALARVRTPLCLLLDVDFLPCPGMQAALHDDPDRRADKCRYLPIRADTRRHAPIRCVTIYFKFLAAATLRSSKAHVSFAGPSSCLSSRPPLRLRPRRRKKERRWRRRLRRARPGWRGGWKPGRWCHLPKARAAPPTTLPHPSRADLSPSHLESRPALLLLPSKRFSASPPSGGYPHAFADV